MRFFKGVGSAIAIECALVVSIWLVAACAFGQPVAKITGPTQTPQGELTSLSSTGSVGDNLRWILPENMTVIQAGCEILDSQLFFSTMRQGSYEFILVVVDKEARIEFAKHIVKVGPAIVDPPPTDPTPVDPPPTDPPPANPGKWSALKEISKANAARLNDKVTQDRLKASMGVALDSLKKRCDQGQCPGLSESQKIIVNAIEQVLITRTGASVNVAWDTGWRVPNAKELDAKKVTNVPDYYAAIGAIIDSL